jgi:hypothetical protein
MKMISVILALFLTTAYSLPPKPAFCPHIMQIKARGLSHHLAQDSNGHWYAGRTAEFYGTPQQWTFVIGDIFANSKIEALAEAYEALTSIVYVSGPDIAPSQKWLCLYANAEGFPTGAIYPPINDLASGFIR